MQKVSEILLLVFFSIGLAVCWLCISANAYAEAAPDFNSTKLTGDWGGERTKLAEQGITFDITATQYYQGVLHGGTNQSWKYGGLMDYRITLIFRKWVSGRGHFWMYRLSINLENLSTPIPVQWSPLTRTGFYRCPIIGKSMSVKLSTRNSSRKALRYILGKSIR